MTDFLLADPNHKNHNRQIVAVSSANQIGDVRLKRDGSTGKLSDQLIRAAFSGQIPSPPTNGNYPNEPFTQIITHYLISMLINLDVLTVE